MDQRLAQELLAALGSHLGVSDPNFAVPPRSLGGSFTEVFRFELADQHEPWQGSLVLRLLALSAPPELLHLQRLVQDGLASAGFPAPRVLLLDDTLRICGRRFMIMEHLPGRPFLRGVRPGRFAVDFPRLLLWWGRTVAAVQAQLHEVDPDVVIDTLDTRGTGSGTTLDTAPPERGHRAAGRVRRPFVHGRGRVAAGERAVHAKAASDRARRFLAGQCALPPPGANWCHRLGPGWHR